MCINKNMDLSTIMQEITSGLTGNPSLDMPYLKSQIEKYKDHELGKEIGRACGRLAYKMIPDDKINKLKNVIENDVESIKATLKEIRFNVFEKDIDRAFEISESLVEKVETLHMFENDSVSIYFSFDNPFEQILYHYHNNPDRQIRPAGIPFGEIFYIHGNLLFELGRIKEAREYLEKALRWEPSSCVIGFEYIETFKMTGELDSFFELTKEQFKYAYKPQDVARCYRNLGFYFVEKELFSIAEACYKISLIYESDNKNASSELYYIHSIVPDDYQEIPVDELGAYGDLYGFPIGPNNDVVCLAYQYGKRALEENDVAWAIYFYEIYCGLVEDEKIQQLVDDLKTKEN